MSQIAVDTSKCRKDMACVAVCPAATLTKGPEGFPVETGDTCIFCGHCVAVCGTGAITHSGLPDEPLLPVPKKLPDPALIDGFLMSRRSVREFKNRPVDEKILAQLLDVARRSPTATNSQKLHWIVVNGAEKVHALAQETANWIRASETNPAGIARWDTGYDFVLRGAPTVVVVCTPADYYWAKQDCATALAFLELAAEARGLGACWAGYLTRVAELSAPLRHALLVPEGYQVQGGLMLGEPTFTYRHIPPRKPLSVQWN